MARRVSIDIEVNENGTVVARRVGDSFQRAANQIERSTRDSFVRMNADVGRQLDDLTRRMTRWGALAAGVFTAIAVRSAAAMGTEFQTRMSAAGAFTQATGAEFDALRKQALALGEATVFTATNAAEAMEQLGLAGFKTTEVLGVMPDVLSLAAAGSLEMGEAAQIASNIMRQMGLSTAQFGRAVDTLAFAASESTTTIQELGVAFSYAGNVARTVGLRVEDVASAFALLANQGVQGERAGTGLVRILSVMLGNIEEGEKGLSKFNLQLFDQEGRFVGLSEAMRRMHAAGMRTQDIMEAFGQRGGPTMLALLNAGSEALDTFTESTKNAGGFAEVMAQKLRDNVGGDAEKLAGVFQTLALTLFDQVTPALRGMLQSAAELGRSWTEMLKGSDVLSGLERSARLLSVTMGVLLVNAARLAALKIGALTVQMLALATGATAVDLALLKNLTLMEAWVLAGTRMKLAALGIAGAIGVIAYQATRAALELTGLDAMIEGFFRRLVTSGDAPTVLQGFTDQLSLIDRQVAKLNQQGIDFAVDPGALDEVRKNVVQLQQIVANGVTMTFGEKDLAPLNEALSKTARQTAEVFGLARAGGADFVRMWTEAGKGAKTLEDRIARVKEMLAKKVPTTSATGPTVDEDAVKRQKAAMESLERGLLSVGLVSRKQLTDAAERFAFLGKIAEAQKVPVTSMVSAFQDELVKLGDAAKKVGADVPPELQKLIDQAQAFKTVADDEKLGKAAFSGLQDAMEGVGLTSRDAIAEFAKSMTTIESQAEAHGIPAGQVVKAFGKEILAMVEAAETAGVAVPESLRKLVAGAEDLREIDLRSEAWDQLKGSIVDVGFATDEMVQKFNEDVQTSLAAAAEHGVPFQIAVRAMKDEILAMTQAAQEAGVVLPEEFARVAEAANLEAAREKMIAFHLEWRQRWNEFRDSAVQSFAQMAAHFVVFGGRLSEVFKNLVKNIAAQAIAMLIQWGVQRLVLGKLSALVAGKEAAVGLASGLAQAYVNSFYSAAAIPFWGWAAAPGIAATNLGIAAAGAAGAAGVGAGIGAAIGGAGFAMAEGGLAMRGPIDATIGERGPEAVVPLRGEPARRAAKAMGIGQGGGGTELHAHFHGDNWRDGGVADDLLETIWDGFQKLIRMGRIRPLPTGSA